MTSSNNAGYVALSEDKKDIAVVFRGTQTPQDWLSNFTVLVTSWDEVDKTAPAADGKETEDAVWVETVRITLPHLSDMIGCKLRQLPITMVDMLQGLYS